MGLVGVARREFPALRYFEWVSRHMPPLPQPVIPGYSHPESNTIFQGYGVALI